MKGTILFFLLGCNEIPKGILSAPKIAHSLAAKEYCSCKFVVGQSHEHCMQKIKKGVPLFAFQVDEAKKMVRVGPFMTSTAAYKNSLEGCSLIE